MLNLFKNLFGGNDEELVELITTRGAVILDVRTPGEYAMGHIKGSVNIPLQELSSKVNKLNKNKPVITCCASGMRSASALQILKSKGYEAYNGGSWHKVNQLKK